MCLLVVLWVPEKQGDRPAMICVRSGLGLGGPDSYSKNIERKERSSTTYGAVVSRVVVGTGRTWVGYMDGRI